MRLLRQRLQYKLTFATWLGLAGAGGALHDALSGTALAAAYSFYSNNTEQGELSTARPAPSPTTNFDGTPPRSSVSASSLEDYPGSERKRWRLMAGAADVNTFTQRGPRQLGASVSLEYEVARSFGIAAFGFFSGSDRNGGADLGWTPIQLSLGPWENMLEMGPVLGLSSLGVPNDQFADRNWVSAHAGARVAVNFGSSLGVVGSVRGNFGFLMGEAGVAIRL